MSAALAEVPRRAPAPAERVRHLDIAPSRSQRRARPRAFYALVIVAGLFTILVAQLLLSIVVSDGAYQISALQQEQKELARDQQSLTEELQVLQSPQHLAANAEELGMVSNSGTAYLRLADGAVLGKAVPAAASGGIRHGKDGGALIHNQLLDGVALTPVSATQPADAAEGAPAPGEGTGSVASTDGAIPSPVTR
jgi:hypothetical protein